MKSNFDGKFTLFTLLNGCGREYYFELFPNHTEKEFNYLLFALVTTIEHNER